MKKRILTIVAFFAITLVSNAQNAYQDGLKTATSSLQNAKTVKDYEKLGVQFEKLTTAPGADWLAPYYSAFCNAKIGWLYQNSGEKIEPYADKAEKQILNALTYLDSNAQKKEISEVYAVLSMVNRSRVFINPMTYGPKNGLSAMQYYQKALKANPSNPRANWLDGWEKFYAPKMFGGDRVKAKQILESAMQQWNAEKPENNYPHWGKAEIETLLKQL
ncbi:MAG TPA: hypothetical protein VK616_09045 [Flavitalea sp.]|nr:hypothetical protein [Flavitalea sp.]